MTDEPSAFERRLERLRAEKAAQSKTASPPVDLKPEDPDSDLIPVLDQDSGVSEERLELDSIISRIDILDAYAKFIGKKQEPAGKKREGIKVSCPTPGHTDNDPSAWVNLDKQAWFCGGCQVGGDIYDLAAFHFGIDYRSDPANFVELKKKIAAAYGYSVNKTLSGATVIEKKEQWVEAEVETPTVQLVPTLTVVAPDTDSTSNHTEAATSVSPIASVIPLPVPETGPQVDDFGKLKYPTFDWQSVITPGTFLDEWMNTFKVDDLPEEYYFWHAMVAIGAATGRSVSFETGNPIYGNLLTCLIGGTGVGKSRSTSQLSKLLDKALPYDYDNPLSAGIKHIPLPGSGEHLQRQFSSEIVDPNDPKRVVGYAPVRGLIDFDEFANLTTRGARAGSTLQQTLMRLFDGYIPRTSMGSITNGTAVVENPFAMGVATTQPLNIQTLVSSFDKSSGFLNRWFFITGTAKKPMAFREMTFPLDESVKKLKAIRTWCSKNIALNFDTAGRESYQEFFDTRIALTKLDEDITNGLLSRLDLAAKKIMLLLCANEHSELITESIVDKMKVLYDYLERTFLFVNGFIGIHEDIPLQQAVTTTIMEYWQKYNKPIKSKDLVRSGRLSRQYGAVQIERIMKSMIALGFIEEMEVTGGRGPSWRGYRVTSMGEKVVGGKEQPV